MAVSFVDTSLGVTSDYDLQAEKSVIDFSFVLNRINLSYPNLEKNCCSPQWRTQSLEKSMVSSPVAVT
jgi:hypothetical protein